MSTPTRTGNPGGASFGTLMLSPKLAMPAASPHMTRLDRVLDLVTEHEAHFREQELRVVDVSRRVAAVEEACDRELAPLREFDVRAELEAAKLAVDRLHHQVTLVAGEQDAARADLQQALEAAHREHQRTREDSARQLAEVKAGFKAVLQDVVDRVANQLDAMRTSEFQRAEQYASGAELTALVERVAAQEREAAAYAQQQKQTLALALAQVDGMQAERDKMKRRMSKLTAFYNSGVGKSGSAAGDGGGGGGGGKGGGSEAGSESFGGGAIVDQLVSRLDEQANETSDLRARYEVLSGKLEHSQAENERLTEKLRAQEHAVRHVERHVSDRAQDMSELMSHMGHVVHTQARAVQAAATSSAGGGGGGGSTGGHGHYSPSAASTGLGAGVLNMGYGAYTSAVAAGSPGGLGAAVERYSAQPVQRAAEAEQATREFDVFLQKMKRRVGDASGISLGGGGGGDVRVKAKERVGEGSSRREGGGERERERDREKEKKRGEGGERKHHRERRGHRSSKAPAEDSS